MAETAKAKLDEIVSIDGKKYKFTGDVDFSNLKIEKIADDVPNPDPPVDPVPEPTPEPQPPVDPTKPNEGVIKPGGWGADLINKEAWKVVNMRKPANEFKIVDGKGKNVATNFKTKEVAENFVAYFKTHDFPPKDENPIPNPPEPGPVDPTPTPTPGVGTDKYGTKLLVADGSTIEYQHKENFRPDGKRFDFKIPDATKGTEAQGYFRFTSNPVDDEVSIKWSEVSHSGKNQVQCYDSGISIKNGKSRMRFENPHPNYSGNLGGGQGVPLNDKFIGYKGIWTPNADGSVTVKLYQDAGNNEGDKPANEWKEVYNYTDTKYKRNGPHPEVTFRVDDPAKKGQKNLEAKWLSVAKI